MQFAMRTVSAPGIVLALTLARLTVVPVSPAPLNA